MESEEQFYRLKVSGKASRRRVGPTSLGKRAVWEFLGRARSPGCPGSRHLMCKDRRTVSPPDAHPTCLADTGHTVNFPLRLHMLCQPILQLDEVNGIGRGSVTLAEGM